MVQRNRPAAEASPLRIGSALAGLVLPRPASVSACTDDASLVNMEWDCFAGGGTGRQVQGRHHRGHDQGYPGPQGEPRRDAAEAVYAAEAVNAACWQIAHGEGRAAHMCHIAHSESGIGEAARRQLEDVASA